MHEADQPGQWTGAVLMRRIGASMEGFSESELEQIRQVSDVDEGRLRRMHAHHEPVPAVLLDTARQFRAYRDATGFAEQIRAGRLSADRAGYAATMAIELPHWPATKCIEVYEVGEPGVRYGNPQASADDVIRISRMELMQGELPRRIVESLTHEQSMALLGERVASDTPSRVAELTNRLAQYAGTQLTRLFKSLYSSRRPPESPELRILLRDFKRLSASMAQELLDMASPQELETTVTKERIPLRLGEEARKLQAQRRLLQAYEGLYLDALDNPDTEALVLHSLENLPGWRDDIRIEVREASLHGTLRAAFGPEGASSCKVLVRMSDGRYQPFDERGNELHGINGLYGALQHALPDAHRKALGLPHVGQGEQLRGLIIQRALPRDALRTVLRMQPRKKPFFRSPRRASGGKRGYPLSGRGSGSQALSIRRRLRTLYPSMTDEQMEEYLQGRPPHDDRWLRLLEHEFGDLQDTMQMWMLQEGRARSVLRARYTIMKAILDAWQKSGEWDLDAGGHYRGMKIHLHANRLSERLALGAELETLPALPANFDHVSNMQIADCGVSDQGARFLSAFRGLRLLDMNGNRLTVLPPALANMPLMEGLDLADNQVVLTAETAQHLKQMSRMVSLSLEGNPIGMSLNVSRMPYLHWLHLAGCGLQEWPAGLFARPRPRSFFLDLSGNSLTRIADVAPGSDRAQILARTVVTRGLLTPSVLERLKLYIESIGLDAERTFPPRGTLESAHWMAGLTQQQWLEKSKLWDALEEVEGSEPFFNELRKLSESSDAGTTAYKADLTAKVWRMIEAMHDDSVLRETLFQMALAPTTCVDAGAQLFNAMGAEVLVHQANAIPSAALKKIELLDLAKGRSRLEELGRIAHARVAELLKQGRNFPQSDAEGDPIQQVDAQGNRVRSIDEVEIYLAYATRLAERLDLPWQSRSMMFREPDVTDRMLEQAYLRVRALEEGDQLRNLIVEQPFWAEYVQTLNSNDFKVLENKGDALTSLLAAQQEWAADGNLSAQQKQVLRETIDACARTLGKSAQNVTPGTVMSDEEYFSEMESLGDQRKNLLCSLTDQIMGRVPAREGLQT
ncbi:leucine-rich repeat-containing protein [Pseudomonas fluorescens]|uniref:RING-type E3 ubiquitin transferase n=2 Tax=Pseudomonas fluorescens TaxID=294 RepID=A0A379I6W4_PSEFL|nr:leucine-rich repeat-containing protein [Pseudomonas fluorescens]